MTQIRNRSGKISTNTLLLGGIFSALVTLIIVVVATRSGSGPSDPKPKPTPGPVPVPIDTSIIRETYKPGEKLRTSVTGELSCPATAKDWGIQVAMTLHYKAEASVLRTIESNDGSTMVCTLQFEKARCYGIFCRLDDVSFNLGPIVSMLLPLLDKATDVPWSALNGASVSPIMKLFPSLQEKIDDQLTAATAKGFAYVDSLQGKTVRVRYVNGKGIQDEIELVATVPTDPSAVLSDDEKNYIRSLALLADATVMKDLRLKEDTSARIDAKDFLSILDPSLRLALAGEVRLYRGSDQGTVAEPHREATLTLIDNHVLSLEDVEDDYKAAGAWTPQGTMIFSFPDQIITKGHFYGDIRFVKHSTKHVFFEARFEATPVYQVDYACEVVK